MTTNSTDPVAPDTAPDAGEPSESDDSLAARCAKAAKRIGRMVDLAQRTEIAQLRRLGRPGHPVPGETAWRFLDTYGRDEENDVWTVMLPLMTRVPHAPGALGYAFHDAKISPARLERWLRRDRAGAIREARLLLMRLQDTGVSWGRMGELLHEWSDEQRTRVARDFFRAERKARRASTSTPSDS